MKIGKFKKIAAIGLALTMAIGLIYSSNIVNAAVNNKVTLTWQNNNERNKSKVNLNYVDESGNYIQAPNVNVGNTLFYYYNNNEVTINSGNYTQIEGYDFNGAYLSLDNSPNKIEKVKGTVEHNKNKIQYKFVNFNHYIDFQDSEVDIYMVFKKVEPLKTVETVDSSKNVTINMYRYRDVNDQDTQIIGGAYASGGVTENLLKNKLDENGQPLKPNGEVLDYFSQNNNNIITTRYLNLNHLFIKDTYNTTGYYEYSSFDNFATLQQNGDFKVYDALGTPKMNSSEYFYNRGNFFPLNNIQPGNFSNNKNLYDENGHALNLGDKNYAEQLYIVDSPTYHFGMDITTNFIQLKDGQVANPTTNELEPMIYEFNGDDDLWVYIDGVLVLDIGGIHDAVSGTINFATGEVMYKDKKGPHPTTIKEMFKEADRFPDGSKWNDKNANQYFKGNTFADYSSHQMKMFYMERGEGASNLKVRFNLPTVPKGEIQIGKQLSVDTDPSVNAGDTKFKFQLYLRGENNQEILVSKDYYTEHYSGYKAYIKEGVTGNRKEEIEWSNDGQSFWLNPGEYAVFPGFNENDVYFVKELDVKSALYDKVTISGVEVTYNEGEDGTYTYVSKDLTVGKNALITYENHVDVKNRNYLEIIKHLAENQNTNDTYKMQVKLDDKLYNGEYYVFDNEDVEGNYTTGEKKVAQNGIIELKQNQMVRIYSILSGVRFEVNEIELQENRYKSPTYQVSINEDNDYKDGNNGTIELDPNGASVIVTNELKTGKLKITKEIDEAVFENGDPVFTFEIQDIYGNTITQNIRFTNDLNKTLSTGVISLPLGEYTITELDTMRYEIAEDSTKVQKIELEDENIEEVIFKNRLQTKDYYSHTDIVVNKFSINENGSVSVSKDYLKEAN